MSNVCWYFSCAQNLIWVHAVVAWHQPTSMKCWYIYYDEVCVCLSRKITTSHFRAERRRREVSRLLWPSDDDDDVDGEEHYIDMLRSSEIPSEAIVVDAARNCVTSLGRSKAQKAFSLSLSNSRTRQQQVLLFPAERLRKCWAPNIFNHTKGFFYDCTLCLNFIIAKTYYPRRQSKRRREKYLYLSQEFAA